MNREADYLVSIMPSAKGFGPKLNSQVGGEVGASGKKMGGIFGKAMLGVVGGIVAGGAILGKFTADAATLDTKMREVVTLFGETGKAADRSLGQVQSQVRNLSSQFGIAQETLTGGLYQAISAGVPRENAFTFMQVASKAAIGGVTDVETAVDGISTTINAFGLSAKDAAAVSDSMFTAVKGGKTTFAELSDSLFNIAPAAAAAGVSFKEVNAGIAALTAGGTPTTVATTQMRAALDGLQKPSADLDAIFGKLGFKNAQLAIESKGLGFALDAVKDASKGNNGELQKLLGSSEAVAAANVLAGTGAKKFADEMRNQAKAAGATKDAFNVVNEGAARQFEIFKTNLRNLGLQVGQVLLPVLTRFAEFVNGTVLPAVKGFLAGMKDGTGVGGEVAAVFKTVSAVFEDVYGFVKANLDVIVPLFAGIATGIAVVKTMAAVTKVWAVAQGILNAVLAANPLGIVVVALAGLVAGLVVAYKRSETFRNIVNGVWNSIKTTVTTVVNAVRSVVTATWNAITAVTSAAWNAIKNTVLVPLRLVLAAVQGDTGKMKAIISEAWAFVKSATTTAWNGIKTAVSSAVTGLVGIVKDIPGKITGALGDLGSLLYDKGRDLIQGLIDGIGDMLGPLGDMAGAVAGKIGDFFPGSPVKEGPLKKWNNGMAGKRLAGMLADGLESGAGLVAGSSRILAGSVAMPTMGPVAYAAGPGAGAGGRPSPTRLHRADLDYLADRLAGGINGAAAGAMRRR